MPSKVVSPKLGISLEPLSQSSFSPFGHAIANPAKHKTAEYKSTAANQGSAKKFLEVTDLTNFYELAPSKKAAKPSINIFSCSPRKLRVTGGQYSLPSAYPKAGQQAFFDVKVLERHPFTSQTFIPLGRGAGDPSTQYLVIVAPTLQVSKESRSERLPPYPQLEPRLRRNLFSLFSRARASPFTNDAAPPLYSHEKHEGGPNYPRGAGLPDLKNIKAFIATGDQAVTYGPGTWHAPMVVLGKEAIDFVVVQYMNGVTSEDVQEVEIQGEEADGAGISVAIEGVGDEILASGTTSVKAKL